MFCCNNSARSEMEGSTELGVSYFLLLAPNTDICKYLFGFLRISSINKPNSEDAVCKLLYNFLSFINLLIVPSPFSILFNKVLTLLSVTSRLLVSYFYLADIFTQFREVFSKMLYI